MLKALERVPVNRLQGGSETEMQMKVFVVPKLEAGASTLIDLKVQREARLEGQNLKEEYSRVVNLNQNLRKAEPVLVQKPVVQTLFRVMTQDFDY
jgi:hypothetical protein